MRLPVRPAALAAGLALAPTVAAAHVSGVAHAHGGLVAGFLHPFTGVDHLAAMVAVGLWAAVLGGAALWAVPASFLAVMAGGAVLGAAGWPLPGVEVMIALSVVALGLASAARWTVPAGAAAALVGAFALFHGAAHGAEMPVAGDPLGYGVGLIAATALLHGAGLAFGLGLSRVRGGLLPRLAGDIVCAFGVLLLVAV